MPSVSVSNLDYFREWRSDEESSLEELLRRLRGEEPQTDAMRAGEALHKALETADLGMDVSSLTSGGYTFYVQCDGAVELPLVKESRIEKRYGDLLVRGRVDGITGTKITDYKSTSYADLERLLEGYQWRFYLDMTGCESFLWKIFTLKEFSDPHTYEITKVEELSQCRYESLTEDCEHLAAEFLGFATNLDRAGIEWKRSYSNVPTTT